VQRHGNFIVSIYKIWTYLWIKPMVCVWSGSACADGVFEDAQELQHVLSEQIIALFHKHAI